MTSFEPSQNPAAGQPITPEVVDGAPETDGEGEQVARPTKLIRIASMVRALLEEARRAPLDDAGRRSLRTIHERSIHELEEILSPDLRDELEQVTLPFTTETPSESELRIAQAQLVGWLEGLFHGIQATLFAQQLAARQQFEQIRQLPPGQQRPGLPDQPQAPDRPGTYL